MSFRPEMFHVKHLRANSQSCGLNAEDTMSAEEDIQEEDFLRS